jgi:hypothetical protein
MQVGAQSRVPCFYMYVVFQGWCGFLRGFGYPYFRYPTVAPSLCVIVGTLIEAQRLMNWSHSVMALLVGARERTHRV